MMRTMALLMSLLALPLSAQETPTPEVAEGEGAWVLVVRKSGGFMGLPPGVVIRETSETATRELDEAVRAATPDEWCASYATASNPSGCCDQFKYTLELRIRKTKNRVATYKTYWYQASIARRPDDLLKILNLAQLPRRKLK